jgi:DNA-binding NtrC family response regulator
LAEKLKIMLAGVSARSQETVHLAIARHGASVSLIEPMDDPIRLDLLRQGSVDLLFADLDSPKLSDIVELSPVSAWRKAFVTLIARPDDARIFPLAEKQRIFDFLIEPFASEEAQSVLVAAQRLSAPCKVLIVDPSPSVRKIIRKILTASVYRLEIEETEEETAVPDLCQRIGFDLVFLDCAPADASGFDMLQRLSQLSPRTRFVMMSVERNRWQERLGYRSGAAAFLHKPFGPVDIDLILHRILGLALPRMTTTGGTVGDFEVRVLGRLVSASHIRNGHVYQFLWFRDPPYLRSAHVQENRAATVAADQFAVEAARVAELELQRTGVLNPAMPESVAV